MSKFYFFLFLLGEIIESLKHGKGTCNYENGDQYFGSWEKDLKSGFGKITYKAGGSYEGNNNLINNKLQLSTLFPHFS